MRIGVEVCDRYDDERKVWWLHLRSEGLSCFEIAERDGKVSGDYVRACLNRIKRATDASEGQR